MTGGVSEKMIEAGWQAFLSQRSGVRAALPAIYLAMQAADDERNRLREALKRIAATAEVVGSETDDGEVGIKTELSEWEMSNIARAALTADDVQGPFANTTPPPKDKETSVFPSLPAHDCTAPATVGSLASCTAATPQDRPADEVMLESEKREIIARELLKIDGYTPPSTNLRNVALVGNTVVIEYLKRADRIIAACGARMVSRAASNTTRATRRRCCCI